MQRNELINRLVILIHLAGGSDQKAVDLIKDYIGLAPNRRTLGRFKHGEGNINYFAFTVHILEQAINEKNKNVDSS